MTRLILCLCAATAVALMALGLRAQPLAAARPVEAPASRPRVPAVAPATRPTTEIAKNSCVTAACHANVKDYKVVHGPVNVDACDSCHTLTDAKSHTFKLAREKEKICTFCHQLDLSKAKFLHKPVASGECLGCHNPHGGFDGKFVRGKTMNDFCKTCHPAVSAGKKFVHGPVAGGACGACHKAHSSDLPKLLVKQGKDLCLSCHEEMAKRMKDSPFKHPAVEQDCQNCHDPHASDYTMQTKAAPYKLCTGTCHEPIKKAVEGAAFKHSAVNQENACLNCHTAHANQLAKLMRQKPVNLCLKCHDKEQKRDERVIKAVPEVADAKLFKHGPIRDGSCGGCHNVHGGERQSLLVREYTTTFYTGFAAEKYDLCFGCHDSKAITTAKTTSLTRFRNGETSLHFVHVDKADRGRSCRACHSTHASAQAMHVREQVPYGNWQLPLNYTQTKTGGSCSPGCHKMLSYDRETPVVAGATTTPATAPAP